MVTFRDPKYQEYTAESPENATYKAVNYYVLLGERVNVGSFAEMIRSVAEKFIELDPGIIDSMARTNETIYNWSTPLFTFTPAMLHSSCKRAKETISIWRLAFPRKTVSSLFEPYWKNMT